MCTFWAVETNQGLWCGFNRDESLQRGRGAAPALREVASANGNGAMAIVAPADTDAGGTWIAANARGLVVALLNNYTAPSQRAAEPIRSRGLLTLDLAGCDDTHTALAWLDQQAEVLRHTRPFELALAAPGQPLQRAVWDGEHLQQQAFGLPAVLASTGWGVDEVRAARAAALPDVVRALQGAADRTAASAALQSAAADHEPGPAGRATCLHGLFARTVSHTQILVAANQVWMRYVDGWPCEESAGPWQQLARRAGG